MGEKAFLKGLLNILGVEDNDVVYIDDLAIKLDGSAASTSKLPFQTWRDFGWRNVAAAVSDLRVKFAAPQFLLASVTVPSLEVAREIIEGIKEASEAFSVKYVGGDLNQGVEAVVDVALLGKAQYRIGRVPRPGDLLITVPYFGYTSIAYRLWQIDHPAVLRGVEMLKRPVPNWPLPSPECVTASMDSSDGLADVLWTMAQGVDIIVRELPTTEEVIRFASAHGLSVEELVFNGGEEYLPVFAVRPHCTVNPPYVVFAEVSQGEGKVWWRGEVLKWKGWSYFA
ncbi:thiamine-monophosphate kinase [Pyrobaculum aerophilum]|uniref:thiamine-phosphate kinase n=1 Tax=Pyrobaculum aerophilum TaxID=13773 RepID=UPI002FD93436